MVSEEGRWHCKINYGPEGEENYANVFNASGEFVGNLKIHHAIEIVTAARVRAEDNAPQPVAWLTRYHHKGREQITVAPTSAASSVPHGRHKLYLEPAPQPSGTVEALEWRTHKGDEFCFVHYDADAIGGSYCIEERKTGDFDLWTPGKSDGARFDTLEAAQAAAQADHERRIRSALTAGGGE